ncbi:hypothetical protein [Synechococcus sp. PCC 7336]|uniref:hypothetical protein n=1 Tax=Synechococcus sp. PCC 7336 TaxID=195250 RepID=UPI00034B91B7|nr:hypothetical protein [Synechococcus sp. PCC 7336]
MASPRTMVMDAVDRLDWRVTVGDVAAETGLSLADTRQELLSLARDAGGHLQVAESGDIAYRFDRHYRNELQRRQRQSQLAALKRKLWQGFLYGLRLSFGIVLVVSIALAVIVITILIASSQKDGRRDSRRRSGGGGFVFIPNLWMGNPFFSPRPYRSPHQRRSRSHPREDSKLNFLEAVYSFLFGDGNPNEDLEERRDRAISNRIAHNGGVITAEEVLPYSDVSPQNEQVVEDEDYMLPVLINYDGQPEVSDRGDIIYRFPELQSAAAERQAQNIPAYLKEFDWNFSSATSGQLTLIGSLGGVNLLLWLGLQGYSFQLADILSIPPGPIVLVFALLALYGLLFLATPTIRWFALKHRNQKVEARNRDRRTWLEQLETPDEALRHKIAFARQFAGTEVFAEDEAIYTTERDLIEQPDYELNSPEFRALEEGEPRSR